MKSLNGKIVLIIFLSLGVLLFAFLWWNERNTNDQLANVTDFTSCQSGGYPVTGSNPRQCKTPDGRTFTEKASPATTNEQKPKGVEDIAQTREFTSQKGVKIRLYDWKQKQTLTSPATIQGEVPGNWSFEASFPVSLVSQNGTVLVQKPAHLQGDWMTTNYVPFSVTLPYTGPAALRAGKLTFHKDNPSDLPENADSVEVPVTYQ